jgi:hypothetical protein
LAQGIVSIFYKVKKNKSKKTQSKKITKSSLDSLFNILSKVYEIEADLILCDNNKFKSKLKINKNSITLDSQMLKRFVIVENHSETSLQNYFVQKGLFSICFDKPEYMYFMGTCFKHKKNTTEIDSILNMMLVKTELKKAISEKGVLSEQKAKKLGYKKNPYTTTNKNFKRNSLFGIVESMHENDEYIYCDDLGDEWADHITFNIINNEMNFIHSKFGEVTNSASKFQDVVGQGLINLGNMFFSLENFKKKRIKLNKFYKFEKETNINLIRKERCDFEKEVPSFLSSYKLKRKCVLCCSFLSRKNIKSELEKLKDPSINTRGNIVQLLWILSSFSHACREMNVIPIIYCVE